MSEALFDWEFPPVREQGSKSFLLIEWFDSNRQSPSESANLSIGVTFLLDRYNVC